MTPGIHFIESTENLPNEYVLIRASNNDKKSLLAALAEACNFPDYFGHNWDAAEECLFDINIDHLAIIADQKFQESQDFILFIELISDVYLSQQRPQLWICSKK